MRMKQMTSAEAAASWLSAIMVIIVLTGGWSAPLSRGEQPEHQSQPLAALPSDPWQVSQLMKPEELAKSLSEASGEKMLVLCVGYPLPYHGAHITGSKYVGPASKPDGIEKLKQTVESLPHDKQIVLYCGCCPWTNCPNIRPAFQSMKDWGFKNVKALYLPRNLRQDWIDKGFPIQKADDAR